MLRRRLCSFLVILLVLNLVLFHTASGEEQQDLFMDLPEGESDVLPIDLSGGYTPDQACYLSDTVYADPSVTVKIEEYTYKKTRCFVAWIRVADPSQLRTAPAYDFTRDQVDTPLNIANRMKAVVAVSGDFCSYWSQLQGGYMVRQGTMYMNQPINGRDTLLIDDHGDFHIVTTTTAEKIEEITGNYQIVNSLNFGPGLVVNGVCLDKDYGAAFNQSNEYHQRAAICQMGENEYAFAVCEGKWMEDTKGLTIADWAQFLYGLGFQQAYNLDGGNSTALVFNGEKINEPGNPNHRQLSDIIYIGDAASANKE